jgi:hypothetical protein
VTPCVSDRIAVTQKVENHCASVIEWNTHERPKRTRRSRQSLVRSNCWIFV